MDLKENLYEGQSVSIIIPTLNEELAIKKVVTDIQRELPKAEILIIDSSTDKTLEIAKELGCVVIRQFPAQGQDAAMYEGFVKASGEVIITIDCDNTYPVDAFKEMLTLLNSGYDLVSACRLTPRPQHMPLANYLANRFFLRLCWLICGVRSKDLHTGMRAYRKNVLFSFQYDYLHPAAPVELQIVPILLGYRCTEIFIKFGARIGFTKLQRIYSTFWTIQRLWNWRWFFNSKRKKLVKNSSLNELINV